jgi:cation diffusion facilitator family transporter
MKVTTVLIWEGISDLVMMLVKLGVGISTNSAAIIGDAAHSLTDLINNIIAITALRISEKPFDSDHHYGHRKFEQLAVFSLAVLLLVVALELVINAISKFGETVEHSSLGLLVMIGALVINILLTVWEHYWARRLDSQLIEADAKHTLSDVLTTIAVIVGWQFAARGYYWVDTLVACLVALIIMLLAFRLLQRSIPILVDYSQHSPERIMELISGLEHVESIKNVRARSTNVTNYADVTITVDPSLSTRVSHQVTERIEQILAESLGIEDVVVHVEPASGTVV